MIEYCHHQGIAAKGHRDDVPLFNDKESDINCGNFKERIKPMSEFDSELKEHILSCKRNAVGHLPMRLQMFLVGNSLE